MKELPSAYRKSIPTRIDHMTPGEPFITTLDDTGRPRDSRP